MFQVPTASVVQQIHEDVISRPFACTLLGYFRCRHKTAGKTLKPNHESSTYKHRIASCSDAEIVRHKCYMSYPWDRLAIPRVSKGSATSFNSALHTVMRGMNRPQVLSVDLSQRIIEHVPITNEVHRHSANVEGCTELIYSHWTFDLRSIRKPSDLYTCTQRCSVREFVLDGAYFV